MMTMDAMAPSLTDKLAQRAACEAEAFGRLYDLYYPKVLRYCVRRLYVRAIAEDVASEIWFQVVRQIRKFRGDTESEFAVWLYGIATKQINAFIRSRKRRKMLLEEAVRDGRIHVPGSSDSQESHLDWPHLYAALADLPPRDQAIITLRTFQGMPFEQLAAVLGITPAHARMAFSRALRSLRARISGSLGET